MEIYKITNTINGKIYIGKDETSNPNYFGSGKLIKRAITKYGIDNFKKEVIEILEDKKSLSSSEIHWIRIYNSTDKTIGYNITSGGDGGDTISNNPNRDAIVKKISNTLKGRTFSEEHKTKLKVNHHRMGIERIKDKEAWLNNLKKAGAKRKGKKLEEIVGKDKAVEIKSKLREKRALQETEMKVGKYTKEGTLIIAYSSQQQACSEENIKQSDISNCISGRQKTVKGFVWKKL